MSYRVVFGPQAISDLEEILIYLAPRMGVEPARDYVRRIETYCLGFFYVPGAGHAAR